MNLNGMISRIAKGVFTYKAGKSGLKGLALLGAGRWLYRKWQSRQMGATTSTRFDERRAA